jgi:hypothetical protein
MLASYTNSILWECVYPKIGILSHTCAPPPPKKKKRKYLEQYIYINTHTHTYTAELSIVIFITCTCFYLHFNGLMVGAGFFLYRCMLYIFLTILGKGTDYTSLNSLLQFLYALLCCHFNQNINFILS